MLLRLLAVSCWKFEAWVGPVPDLLSAIPQFTEIMVSAGVARALDDDVDDVVNDSDVSFLLDEPLATKLWLLTLATKAHPRGALSTVAGNSLSLGLVSLSPTSFAGPMLLLLLVFCSPNPNRFSTELTAP